MYIPLGFMGTFGACITASVTTISGSGVATSGSFISGSDVYDFIKFEQSSLTDTTLGTYVASLNIISGAVDNVNLLIVGGGAGGQITGSLVDVESWPGGYTYEVDNSGGGGAGGIVYYNNLSLATGTYQIGVGAAAKYGIPTVTGFGITPQNNLTGSVGNSSYFIYNYPFPAFNSQTFTAYGGGNQTMRGEFYSFNFGRQQKNIFGVGGGSGGGVGIARGKGPFPAYVGPASGTLGSSPNGFNNGLQGFNGGNFFGGDASAGGGLGAGTGGGGATTNGVDANFPVTGNVIATNGGAGVYYNISGSPVLFSGGGAGAVTDGYTGNNQQGTRGSTSYGAGGNGRTNHSLTNSIGNAGLVYIEWKRCFDEKCKTFSIETASSPLTMSFVKCGESVTSSLSLNSFEQVTVCALSASGSPTFTSSPGAIIQELGNCVTFENNTPTPVAVKYTFLRYDVDINCNESNPTEVYSLNNYADGLYLIGGTLYRLTPNTHINYTIEITSATSSSCTPPPPPFPISGSLKIWSDTTTLTGSVWRDRSGNANNGLVSGSALALTGSLGYEFNGTNNYVTYPITLTGQPTTAYTLQYYGSLPSETTNRDFFVKEVYTNGWDIIYRGDDTKDFVFRDQAGQDRISPAITPTYGQKQLITITANTDSNVMQLYSNNTLLGTFSGTVINPFNAAPVPFVFGFNSNFDATYWKGGVKALLLYNKVLNATEVSQSYAWMVDNY